MFRKPGSPLPAGNGEGELLARWALIRAVRGGRDQGAGTLRIEGKISCALQAS